MDYIGGFITKNPVAPTDSAASGVWRINQALQYTKAGTWPVGNYYLISKSVRLRSSASAYFSRAQATGNTQKATWSGWIKRGTLTTGSYSTLFNAGTANTDSIVWNSTGDSLRIWLNGATSADLITTQQFRDPSAWYHIVVAIDTTQATSSNRILLYVNGVQVTAFTTATYPTQNYTFTKYNTSGQNANLGGIGASYFFDGYMAEVNWIDGQQLTPTSFGAFNATTGVWNPIAYTGTYGTNGYYLNFKDATSTTTIGYDYSGNSNNWTANNISVTAGTTYDSMVDSPTNYGTDTGVGGEVRGDYCTGNPLWAHTSTITLSNGNLTAVWPGYWFGGTFSIPLGQWYWEFQITAGTVGSEVGIATIDRQQDQGLSNSTTGYAYGYRNDGQKFVSVSSSATFSSYGSSYTTNDIVGVAFDSSNSTITFYKNGVSQGSAFTTVASGTYIPAFGNTTGSSMTAQLNFGQRTFSYPAPSGYKALCTQNLSTPTINNGANYMAATLYTGTGASLTVSNAVNSISFQPDLVWMKSRSAATNHALYDSVRGVTKDIASNTTAAETTETTGLTAFGTTGFTIGALASINTNAATYVGWQWKGGGTAVTNTAGSITSSVSANTTAGFSVVTWTATGANATVGHGLGVSPSMIILKPRSQSDQWPTWINTFAVNEYVYVNLTNAKASLSTFMNGTLPSSSVVSLGTWSSVGTNNVTMVMYCFAAISGYSAFGSYTGNGSTDGPFVFTGFRPRWIMVKRTDSAANWYLWDTARDTYNVAALLLVPNSSIAESSSNALDILSNGFKLRATGADWNASGGTFIYAAFAENPFKIARAR